MERRIGEDITLLRWDFTPKNYFEEEIRITQDNYEMVILDGVVEARIDPRNYDSNQGMRDSLHKELNDRFLGVQLLTHKKYKLSKSSLNRLHPDGRKDVTVFPEPCNMTLTVSDNVDIVQKNKDGEVVFDSRRDRIEKKKVLAELTKRYSSDATVAALLNSYKTAVEDPENELVHLYEIRDALSKLFQGEKFACKTLGLSTSKWSRLGQLANNESLRQGRHRGKDAGNLRDASDAELAEAREIASHFVEAYLIYLDECNGNS